MYCVIIIRAVTEACEVCS